MVQSPPDGIRRPDDNAGTLLIRRGEASPVAGGPGWHSGRHFSTAPAEGSSTENGQFSNLKAAQALLGHESIQTTGDVYTDWDIDRLRATLAQLNEGEE